MVSNRVLLGMLCLAGVVGIALPDRHPIGHGLAEERLLGAADGASQYEAKVRQAPNPGRKKAAIPAHQSILIVQAAQAEIGVRERSENSGTRVDDYNRYAGVSKAPWCASFVSFCFAQAGLAQPRTAWSPALFPRERCVALPKRNDGQYSAKGLVLGIYYVSKGRIAHCGIVERIDGDWVFSIEGNTNTSGGREGDGVYAKKRHRSTIARYSNWIREM